MLGFAFVGMLVCRTAAIVGQSVARTLLCYECLQMRAHR